MNHDHTCPTPIQDVIRDALVVVARSSGPGADEPWRARIRRTLHIGATALLAARRRRLDDLIAYDGQPVYVALLVLDALRSLDDVLASIRPREGDAAIALDAYEASAIRALRAEVERARQAIEAMPMAVTPADLASFGLFIEGLDGQ